MWDSSALAGGSSSPCGRACRGSGCRNNVGDSLDGIAKRKWGCWRGSTGGGMGQGCMCMAGDPFGCAIKTCMLCGCG